MPIFALLPAAGVSSRMGCPKLALPLGGRLVLERVLDALRAAKIDKILVVLGPQSRSLQSQATAAGAQPCFWNNKRRTCARPSSVV